MMDDLEIHKKFIELPRSSRFILNLLHTLEEKTTYKLDIENLLEENCQYYKEYDEGFKREIKQKLSPFFPCRLSIEEMDYLQIEENIQIAISYMIDLHIILHSSQEFRFNARVYSIKIRELQNFFETIMTKLTKEGIEILNYANFLGWIKQCRFNLFELYPLFRKLDSNILADIEQKYNLLTENGRAAAFAIFLKNEKIKTLYENRDESAELDMFKDLIISQPSMDLITKQIDHLEKEDMYRLLQYLSEKVNIPAGQKRDPSNRIYEIKNTSLRNKEVNPE